jgi:hypothetical protein
MIKGVLLIISCLFEIIFHDLQIISKPLEMIKSLPEMICCLPEMIKNPFEIISRDLQMIFCFRYLAPWNLGFFIPPGSAIRYPLSAEGQISRDLRGI